MDRRPAHCQRLPETADYFAVVPCDFTTVIGHFRDFNRKERAVRIIEVDLVIERFFQDRERVALRGRDEIGVLAREFNAMAASLARQRSELLRAERLAAVGRISAQITHEIRNPLNAIGLNTELLAEELAALPAASAEGRQLLSAITREVDRLNAVTEHYLRFARLPRGNTEPIELNELLAGLLDFLAPELAASRVVVERAFGMLEVHHEDKGEVRSAGDAILRHLGAKEEDRAKPKVVSNTIIRAIEPMHAMIIDKIRFGSMIEPGRSLFILETEPAGYPFAVVQGKTAEQIQKELGQVAEGVRNAKSARELARRLVVDMPITELVYRVLYEGVPPKDAVTQLMMRETKPEL